MAEYGYFLNNSSYMNSNQDKIDFFIKIELHDYVKRFKPMFASLMRKYNEGQKIKITEEELKDLIQESVLVAFEKVRDPNFTLTSKGSTFLYGIARLKILELLRKKGQIRTIEVDDETLNYFEDKDPLLKEETNSTLNKYLIECMKKLSVMQKRVIELFFYHKLSMKQIALDLKSTEDSVKNQNARAKKALFNCINSNNTQYERRY